jgi:Cu2+-exporting ATPase
MSTATGCWHCGEPLPSTDVPQAMVAGTAHPVCCHGCRAAAEWISELGLADYYRLRSALAPRAPGHDEAQRAARPWARPELARHVVRELVGERHEVIVLVEGLRCAACTWLIERSLAALAGIVSVEVNAGARRARIVWQRDRVSLAQIVETLARTGYRARPLDAAALDDARRRESRQMQKYLVVAGFGAMQAMMYASALYFGALDAADPATGELMRWLGLLVATPVVLYAARPFFAGAARSLAARRLGMDVPVALAITLIYAGSVYAVVHAGAEVYFESVSMFVFFLLAGRYLEMRARHRTGDLSGALARLAPMFAQREDRDGGLSEVCALDLAPGDRVHVAEGSGVPADGVLESGQCRVDEALLSGESQPIVKRSGDAMIAGSMVVEGSATVRVERVGGDTVLSGIVALAGRAATGRPRLARAGERAAAGFVARVLALAALTALGWGLADPQRAFSATIAVLVVSCPCAFALAAPAAVTRALGVLARRGVLVVRPDAIEQLALVTHVMFDKTGTLTDPRQRLERVQALRDVPADRALALAAALARGSRHPAAQAIAIAAGAAQATLPVAGALQVHVGDGLSGQVEGRPLRLGRADFSLRLGDAPGAQMPGQPPVGEAPGQRGGQPLHSTLEEVVILADDAGAIAAFHLSEQLRAGAREGVDALRSAGLQVEMVSGDAPARVARSAAQLGIARWQACVRPDGKLARLAGMRDRKARVMVVGDGSNDAPVLAGADVAVAIASGSDLAQASSDIVLAGGDLRALAQSRELARATLAVLRQNHRWALGYNLAVLPLGALGFVSPWVAALGMSASSLLVVLNALRIGRPAVPARTTAAARASMVTA